MKYIIMCGGQYPKFKTPKQLLKVNGEVIVERTIRLLKENGIKDISISTTNPAFDYLDVPKLKHKNEFVCWDPEENKKSNKCWLNAFYQLNEPVCYLYGDVYYSGEAIKTIVETPVKDTMYFCVPDKCDVPNKDKRNTKGREPLAFKVTNYKKFNDAVNDLLAMVDQGVFADKIQPFSWHLYRYLNGLNYLMTDWGEMNNIFTTKGDYTIINDYTTDVDSESDIIKIECFMKEGGNMIKVEAIKDFNLGRFDELKNIVRKGANTKGHLNKGDVFECEQGLAEYLTGKNDKKLVVVRVIEVIPEAKVEEPKIERETIIEEKPIEIKPKKSYKYNKKSKKVVD